MTQDKAHIAPSRDAERNLSEPFGQFVPTTLQAIVIGAVRRNQVLRAAVRTRANRLLDWLRPGPIDHELFGWKFRFFPMENTGDRKALLSPSQFDLTECELIAKHLPEGGVFLDIGSNIGVYTFYVLAHRKDARVFAFEPTPRVAAKLRYNLATNQLTDRASVLEIAVSDVTGTTTFNLEHESLVLGDGGITVKTDTLLNALDGFGRPPIGALKIDVEGVEDRVLRPFFEKADKAIWPKLVVIEHLFPDQWSWDCLGFLEANGYTRLWRGSMNTVYQLTDTPS